VPQFLQGDDGRLGQILTNLLSNAIAYTEKGQVDLHVVLEETTEAQVMLNFSITDTGIGIAQEMMHKLFESFSQVDSSTTRRFAGTGLGLNISQRLAKMMHGNIRVESHEGVGSTFRLSAKFNKQPDQPHTTLTWPAELQKKRLMVLDGKATSRRILSAYLVSWGLQVKRAANLQDALTVLKKNTRNGKTIDVIIVDSLRPGIAGQAIKKCIRSDPKLKNVKLVMVTPVGTHTHTSRLRELGFDTHLTKPIKKTHLHECLLALLDPQTYPIKQQIRPAHWAVTLPIEQRSKIRILIAEDNPTNRKVMHYLLTDSGYNLHLASNGEQALKAFKTAPFDLILMDVQMPIMDGFETTRKIRSWEASRTTGISERRHIPIIATTAMAIKGDREKCLAAGMDDYIVKPIDPEELDWKVAHWCLGAPQYAAFPEASTAPQAAPADPTGPAAPAASPIDMERALKNTKGSVVLLKKLVAEFQKIKSKHVAIIDGAIKEMSATRLIKEAHELKGVAACLGFGGVTEAALNLENLGRSGNMSHTESPFKQLQVQLDRLDAHLDEIDWDEVDKTV